MATRPERRHLARLTIPARFSERPLEPQSVRLVDLSPSPDYSQKTVNNPGLHAKGHSRGGMTPGGRRTGTGPASRGMGAVSRYPR